MLNRSTYLSESEMKSALQGTYTYYEDDEVQSQIHIDGDIVYYRDNLIVKKYIVESWNCRNGTIDNSGSNIFVTNLGNLRYHGNIYKKGGSWSPTPFHPLPNYE